MGHADIMAQLERKAVALESFYILWSLIFFVRAVALYKIVPSLSKFAPFVEVLRLLMFLIGTMPTVPCRVEVMVSVAHFTRSASSSNRRRSSILQWYSAVVAGFTEWKRSVFLFMASCSFMALHREGLRRRRFARRRGRGGGTALASRWCRRRGCGAA